MSEPFPSGLPPRDRRRGKRIVTLKNFGWLLLASMALLVVLNLASEFRHIGKSEHGRLYEQRLEAIRADAVQPETAAVQESAVADEIASDPFLVDPARRERYLGVDDDYTLRPIGDAPGSDGLRRDLPQLSGGTFVDSENDRLAASETPPRQSVPSVMPHDGKILITGGADGVQLQVVK